MTQSLVSASAVLARVAIALAMAGGAQASAQCVSQWLPGEVLPGIDGTAFVSMEWDPDGAGPATPVLVVGGQIDIAGELADANGIAAFDPQTGRWSALGSGLQSSVTELAALPNGDLVAAGNFQLNSGGNQLRKIARWNSGAWLPLGSGPNTSGSIYALAVLPNGDLIAAGTFSSMNGVAASRIARWDGTTWSPLGSGTNNNVWSLLALPNGDLLAGGEFTSAGGVSASRIARWSGGAWSALGSGVNGIVGTLDLLPNGDLLASGGFSSAGGVSAQKLARWNGAAWSAYAGGLNVGSIESLAVLSSGDVVIGGVFGSVGGVAASNIARWNGSAWSALGPADALNAGVSPIVRTVTPLSNGQLFVGGAFSPTPHVAAKSIALWDGANWSAFGNGLDAPAFVVRTAANGDVIVGGRFTAVGGALAGGIAQRTGTTWATFAGGIRGPAPATVFDVLSLPNGDLVAGGMFTAAGNVAANNIARWDGAAWFQLGAGIGASGDSVHALALLPNGELVAGGYFATAGGSAANGVARWDGAAWWPLGSGVGGASIPGVSALVVLPNGDLVAGGVFTTAGGVAASTVARWDGAAWWPLGSGVNSLGVPVVRALAVLPSGDLVTGGSFSTAGAVAASNIARWDGSAWWPLGSGVSGSVESLLRSSNGDVIVGGLFTSAGGVPANRLARWNGSTWISDYPALDNGVYGIAELPSGELVACGWFTSAGGAPSVYFAQTTSPCTSYCSAGVSSNSCTATMSGVGAASASASSGYTLSATSVEGDKQGLIL